MQLLPTHNVQVPSKCARFYFGLSWSAKANIDIDASAVCLAGAQVADIISFQKLRDATPASIVHTGDVLTSGTGTGTSDLERIYVQPEAMEKRGVDNIFLVVNVYTQGRTFCDVSSATRAWSTRTRTRSWRGSTSRVAGATRWSSQNSTNTATSGTGWASGSRVLEGPPGEVAKAPALRMVPVNAPPVQAAAPPPTIVQVLVQPGMPVQIKILQRRWAPGSGGLLDAVRARLIQLRVIPRLSHPRQPAGMRAPPQCTASFLPQSRPRRRPPVAKKASVLK